MTDSATIESLVRFLPAWTLRRLAASPEPMEEPSAEVIRGTLLLADVKGFTALTERLAAQGPAGAEEISRRLDICFGTLVNRVTAHGGDVVKFAGDAMLAYWSARPDGREAAAVSALQRGLAIQRNMARDASFSEDGITLRICVGEGDLLRLIVGGVLKRWESVLYGEPLRQIRASIAAASPGEVLVSSAAWELISGRCEGTQVAGVNAWRVTEVLRKAPLRALVRPIPTPEAFPAMRAWLPGVVLNKIDVKRTAWMNELRRVSVGFARLPAPSGDDPQAAMASVHAATTALQRCVYRYGGSIDKVAVDEKGALLVTVFGLPPLAHEDDPLRCVRAAMAMRDELRRLGVRPAIGLATGLVFCGTIGSETRCDYTVMGAIVNLAARLVDRAEDDIACCPETWAAANERVGFDALGSFSFKGIDLPVAVYRPTAVVKQATRASGALVGREDERAVLADAMQSLVRGRMGNVIVVSGEPGIGKSRLVEELREQAVQLGVRVMEGEANALETATPYFVWREVVESLIGGDANPGAEECQRLAATVVAELEPRYHDLGPLLCQVMAHTVRDTARTATMSGEGRALSTQRLIAALLMRACGAEPTLLILQDAHWFDSASWGLLKTVLQRVEGLVVVLATRPMGAEPPQEYRWVTEQHGAQVLNLVALGRDETSRLVCHRLGLPSLPDDIADLIWRRTSGNPLFVEELCHVLSDGGLVTRDEDGSGQLRASSKQLNEIALPNTVQGLVVSRIDQLPVREQLLLKVASVIGRQFPADLLGAVYPVRDGRTELDEMLPDLVSRDLLRSDADDGASFIFKHALTHEAVYGLMLYSQRRELHHAVAVWYEENYAADLAGHYGLLAHHWREAAAWDKAIHYVDLAAQQALTRYSNREAVALFDDAIALNQAHPGLVKPDSRQRWYLGLAEAHHRLGDIPACRSYGHTALGLAGMPVASTPVGQFFSVLRGVAVRVLQRWLPTAFRVRDPEERARRLELTNLLNRLTEVHIYREDALACMDSGLREINTAEPSGASAELGRAYAMMAVVIGTVPLRGVANAWVARALSVLDDVAPTAAVAFVHSRVGVYQIYLADWPAAEANGLRARDIATGLGDQRMREETTVVLGLTLYYAGRLKETLPMWEQAREWARKSGNSQTLSWSHIAQAGALLRLGRAGEALAVLDDFMPWIVKDGNATEKVLGHGLTALAHLRMGRPEEALSAADLIVGEIIGRRPVAYWIQHIYAGLAEVYLSLWRKARCCDEPVWRDRADELRIKSRRTCATLRTFGGIFPFGKPAALLWTGVYHSVGGDAGKAQRALTAAVAESRRLKMRYEEGLARRELGSLLESQDPERERHLNAACVVLEDIEARYDLELARSLIDMKVA